MVNHSPGIHGDLNVNHSPSPGIHGDLKAVAVYEELSHCHILAIVEVRLECGVGLELL